VKNHPWLKDFPWQQLTDRNLISPFIPSNKEDNFDSRNINENWKDNQDVLRENSLLLKQNSVQSLFNGYYYDHSVETRSADVKHQIVVAANPQGPNNGSIHAGSSQTTNASNIAK
jgi:hypothetical protein